MFVDIRRFSFKTQKKLHIIFARLSQYNLQDTWHPFIIGRFVGSHLLYYHFVGQEDGKFEWVERAKQYGKHFASISRINYWKFPYYQFMICDYLNLVKEYQLAYELLFPLRNIKNEDVMVEDGYYDALLIINGVSIIGMRTPTIKARKWKSTGFNKFGITFQKYFTLQYLIGCLQLLEPAKRKERRQLREKIDQLIQQTGFVYFKDII